MSNINKIEAIQRRAARFVFKDFARFSSVTSMLCSLSWPTLRERRCSLKLLMLYKIVNQLVDISPASYLKRTARLSRRHNCCYQLVMGDIENFHLRLLSSEISRLL